MDDKEKFKKILETVNEFDEFEFEEVTTDQYVYIASDFFWSIYKIVRGDNS